MQDSLDLTPDSQPDTRQREMLAELVEDYRDISGALHVPAGTMSVEQQAFQVITSLSSQLRSIEEVLRISSAQEGIDLKEGEPPDQIRHLIRQLVAAVYNYHWLLDWTTVDYKAFSLMAEIALLYESEKEKDMQLKGLSLLMEKQGQKLEEVKKNTGFEVSARIYAHQLRAQPF